MELNLLTWPEVHQYLVNKKSILIPVGSTEQHGPTGIIGTDYLTANAIAIEAGKLTETMVAPPLCYGMALHHMAFPGSAALKPSTYLQVVKEIISSFAQHGFEKFYFVNGHGGNIPTLQACFSEVLEAHPKISLHLFNWWVLEEVKAYEEIHFKDLNGFHATCGEISTTMHCFPEAFKREKIFTYFKTTEKSDWPLSPTRFRETFPDGRMGSDPRLASATHGAKLFELASRSIANKIHFDS